MSEPDYKTASIEIATDPLPSRFGFGPSFNDFFVPATRIEYFVNDQPATKAEYEAAMVAFKCRHCD